MTDDQKKNKQNYDNLYIKQNYDRVNLTLPKGSKEALTAVAAQHGLSLNAYIRSLLMDVIEK